MLVQTLFLADKSYKVPTKITSSARPRQSMPGAVSTNLNSGGYNVKNSAKASMEFVNDEEMAAIDAQIEALPKVAPVNLVEVIDRCISVLIVEEGPKAQEAGDVDDTGVDMEIGGRPAMTRGRAPHQGRDSIGSVANTKTVDNEGDSKEEETGLVLEPMEKEIWQPMRSKVHREFLRVQALDTFLGD